VGVLTLVPEMLHKSVGSASLFSSDSSDSILCKFRHDLPWHPLYNSEHFKSLLRREHAVVQLFVHLHKMNSGSSWWSGSIRCCNWYKTIWSAPPTVLSNFQTPTISEFDNMLEDSESELQTKMMVEIFLFIYKSLNTPRAMNLTIW